MGYFGRTRRSAAGLVWLLAATLGGSVLAQTGEDRVSPREASRFLAQATMGANWEEIHRTSEIGILRAIGLRSGEILVIFLSKAVLLGLLGGLLGAGVGWMVGGRIADVESVTLPWNELIAAIRMSVNGIASGVKNVG